MNNEFDARAEDRDPQLQALFAVPVNLSAGDDFHTRVMTAVARSARLRRGVWWLLDLVAVLVLWVLAEPLQALLQSLLPWLMRSLIDLGEGPWTVALQPVNNAASLLALLFLVARTTYRRLLA